MSNNILANQVYDYLLENPANPHPFLRTIKWVIGLTLIDDAIKVIEIWLREFSFIECVEDLEQYLNEHDE